MMRAFHVDPSWYEDHWYGEQRVPKQRWWMAGWVAMAARHRRETSESYGARRERAERTMHVPVWDAPGLLPSMGW